MLFVADKIQAIYNVWFLGDAFFKNIYDTLKQMKAQAKVQHKQPPYMDEYYNVHGFWKTAAPRE